MTALTKYDILAQAEEHNVKFIRLQFTDVFGVFKNIAVTVEELNKALDGELFFDSSVIDGAVSNREKDIYLKPDPNTFVIFPWRPREGAVARLICDIGKPDGTAYECCSRQVLKKALAEADSMGLQMMVGAETEFFLFHKDERNNPTTLTHDTAGFCDLSPVDLGENARRDMVLILEEMGYEISSSHHEFAPGQHEICLKDDDALIMADKLVTFRFVVRTIANRHGLHASFMPKPVNGLSGSGLHINQLLRQNTDNAFFAPQGERQLSETALFYVGGLLKHARAYAAITNPLVNSYKRLIAGDCSPCYVAWAHESRNTMIKIPVTRGDKTRVEMRNPDSACNPYLALAVMLRAGLDGIRNRISPPMPLTDNPFRLSPAECLERGIYRLPANLGEAIQLIKQDELMTATLGSALAEKYVLAKEAEWAEFEKHVHQWENEKYLSVY